MKNLKQNLPEYYLIIVVFLTAYTPPFQISPVAIGIITFLALLSYFKWKFVGILSASLFILIAFFMFLALVSEVKEFPTFNKQAITMLSVGSILILLNIAACGLMIYKYSQEDASDNLTNRPASSLNKF